MSKKKQGLSFVEVMASLGIMFTTCSLCMGMFIQGSRVPDRAEKNLTLSEKTQVALDKKLAEIDQYFGTTSMSDVLATAVYPPSAGPTSALAGVSGLPGISDPYAPPPPPTFTVPSLPASILNPSTVMDGDYQIDTKVVDANPPYVTPALPNFVVVQVNVTNTKDGRTLAMQSMRRKKATPEPPPPPPPPPPTMYSMTPGEAAIYGTVTTNNCFGCHTAIPGQGNTPGQIPNWNANDIQNNAQRMGMTVEQYLYSRVTGTGNIPSNFSGSGSTMAAQYTNPSDPVQNAEIAATIKGIMDQLGITKSP